jgi:uncharacterized protein (DUF1800 family)
LDWQFEYRANDHDDGDKTFLGHTGPLNGEDVIDIICQQPATARFIARHLYNFFVADEVQVPSWSEVPPRDPQAVATLAEAFVQHDYVIRDVLRVLFNADFFQASRFTRIKSPAELVVGAVRMAGGHRFPDVSDINLGLQTGFMGQQLLDPPSVEGWHTGTEWINTASLMARINFASEQFSNAALPGISAIIDGVVARNVASSAEALVDACLDLMGPLSVHEQTRQELVAHAADSLSGRDPSAASREAITADILELLQLIVATREYQLA